MPSPTIPTTSETGIRRWRIHGVPAICAGSMVIRLYPTAALLHRQDVHRQRGRVALDHAAAGAGPLAAPRLAPQLGEDLVDLGHAGGADGVALGDEAAAGVYRDRA